MLSVVGFGQLLSSLGCGCLAAVMTMVTTATMATAMTRSAARTCFMIMHPEHG